MNARAWRWILGLIGLALVGQWWLRPDSRIPTPGKADDSPRAWPALASFAPRLGSGLDTGAEQAEVEPLPPLRWQEFTLNARARFEVRARVLSRMTYRFDAESALAPLDLALGWGPMADPEILAGLEIWQSRRWLHWRAPEALPIDREAITAHSANVHVVPADTRIAERLGRIEAGRTVWLLGYLIDVERQDGWRWNTSLSRTDDGAGACEILYVTAVRTRD